MAAKPEPVELGLSRRAFFGAAGLAACAALSSGCSPDPQTLLDLVPAGAAQPRATDLARDVRIHPIQTGVAAFKTALAALRGPPELRWFSIVADPFWTPPLPICCWLIEHPDGLVLVDTGVTGAAESREYYQCDPLTGVFFAQALRYAVRPEHEIGPRLEALGFAAADIRRVVLTHLHPDHVGGAATFPNAEFLVSRREYEAALASGLSGALPCRWPVGLAPRLLEIPAARDGELGPGEPLTADGIVRLVATPGHTAGHASVLVRAADGPAVLLAGDVTITQGQLLGGVVAGVVADVPGARRSIAAVRRFAQATPVIYLPTHDPAGPGRLARGAPLPPG